MLPASLLVGAMASRIVIYLVPLFALVIFSFGLYSDAGEGAVADAVSGAGMPALFAEAAFDAARIHEGVRVAAVLATIYATLYAANSLGRLLRRSTALVWDVPYTRPARMWRLPLAVVGLTILAWALGSIGKTVSDWDLALFIGAVTLELAVVSLFWLLVSRLLPRAAGATRWSDLLPGAILAAVGVVGLRVAMVVYFAPEVEQLSARYGSIGLALVMLTWSYWLGMIVIGSAELNAALFQSRKARGQR